MRRRLEQARKCTTGTEAMEPLPYVSSLHCALWRYWRFVPFFWGKKAPQYPPSLGRAVEGKRKGLIHGSVRISGSATGGSGEGFQAQSSVQSTGRGGVTWGIVGRASNIPALPENMLQKSTPWVLDAWNAFLTKASLHMMAKVPVWLTKASSTWTAACRHTQGTSWK